MLRHSLSSSSSINVFQSLIKKTGCQRKDKILFQPPGSTFTCTEGASMKITTQITACDDEEEEEEGLVSALFIG